MGNNGAVKRVQDTSIDSTVGDGRNPYAAYSNLLIRRTSQALPVNELDKSKDYAQYKHYYY